MAMQLIWIFLLFGLPLIKGDSHKPDVYARCDMVPDPDPMNPPDFDVTGTIAFKQKNDSKFVFYKISLSGFESGEGAIHRFHVHTYGTTFEGCGNTGGHFNPLGTEHGEKHHNRQNRHVGDLSHMEVGANGMVMLEDSDKIISLRNRKRGIIGRSVVIEGAVDDEDHEDNGDHGDQGDHDDHGDHDDGYQKFIACCPIVHSDGSEWDD